MGSNAQKSGRLDLDDLQMTGNYRGFKAYAASRLATMCFSQELAARLAGESISVNCLHPGGVDTNIWDFGPDRRGYHGVAIAMLRLFLISAEKGAETPLYLATSRRSRI